MTFEEMEELERKYKNGIIDKFEFLESIPDEYIPDKKELIKVLKEKEE